MRFDFEGKTALVTGASRGIGYRIAADLAACGARLIVTSTSTGPADKLIGALGPDTHHITVDFADVSSTSGFLEFLRDLPELQVLVNNAGTTRHGPLEQATEADWDVIQDVHVKVPFFISQAVAEVMKRGGYGRIVNIASIWAHQTMAERSLYTTAKSGLRGMTMSFALELAPHNILVNAVAPGFTLTDMVKANYTGEQIEALEKRIPLGRLGEFLNCSQAHAQYAGEYGSGQLDLTRLSAVDGLDCAAPDDVVVTGNAAWSGAWFNPERSGEGFILEFVGESELLAYWFTYDTDGSQMWMLGLGELNAEGRVDLMMQRASGGRFGDEFDPENVQLQHWGEVSFQFGGCDDATYSWAAPAPYDNGTFDLGRLTALKNADC